jgi:hypothetical protein
MSQPTDIYRATERADCSKIRTPYSTRRQPGRVPYLVDNLWAWTRPEGYPDRRQSAYASPTPEQAVASALGEEAVAYRVQFQGDYTLAQLTTGKDASDHPDCRALKKRVRRALDDGNRYAWASRAASDKDLAGRLYYPCLSAEEVEEVFRSVDALRAHRDAIRDAVTFWDDVTLITGDTLANSEGELFFTYPGGYKLAPIEV